MIGTTGQAQARRARERKRKERSWPAALSTFTRCGAFEAPTDDTPPITADRQVCPRSLAEGRLKRRIRTVEIDGTGSSVTVTWIDEHEGGDTLQAVQIPAAEFLEMASIWQDVNVTPREKAASKGRAP